MSNFSLNIDPSDVLGVARDASMQDIRDAYRVKAKRYHPDSGGEDWAFRILVQAYEILCTERVVRATHREFNTPRPDGGPSTFYSRRPAQPPPFSPEPPPAQAQAQNRPRRDSTETVRPGIEESAVDPVQLVEVEKLTVRYEAGHVWLITEHLSEERVLSCSLNLSWPDAELPFPPSTVANAEGILRSLGEVVDTLTVKSRAVSASSQVVEGRFTGWLSYHNNERALAAFDLLREMLHENGLVVKQWSRDLMIPRSWR